MFLTRKIIELSKLNFVVGIIFHFKASESQRAQGEEVLTEFFFKVENKSKEETWLCQRVLVTRLNVGTGGSRP